MIKQILQITIIAKMLELQSVNPTTDCLSLRKSVGFVVAGGCADARIFSGPHGFHSKFICVNFFGFIWFQLVWGQR